jgi:hypothetical protein
MKIISPPAPDEYPSWFAGEIELVHYDDLLRGLKVNFQSTIPFLQNIPDEKLLYRYQPGKWTIKEIWQHVIDVERILSYRALRYARNDATVLSGFNENEYATQSAANNRQWKSIIAEFETVRAATLSLFESFTDEMILLKGTTGKSTMTVRAVGCLILGHEIHHVNTITERYLNNY